MNGLHLTADLRDCATDCAALSDMAALRKSCLDAVALSGLTPVGELFHAFPTAPGAVTAGGVTGVVLLAESHLAVHTWPELSAVTVDVYVCNFGADNTARAHQLMDSLQAVFSPRRIERHALPRGRTE
ncbi:MAG: hypothetical protein RLZZ618_2284 [Pseudomonadota bacterium]|jgi:S-adenosylmethionine decarboxylase